MKFCFIKILNLSNCDLLTRENLVEILGNSVNSLKILNLSNNSLDEAFIKKFTLSQRLAIGDLS
jgi:dimeric dUTPase (all-alpha-NTP-PPase superfamily)